LNENNQILTGKTGDPINTNRNKGVKKERIRISKGDKKVYNNLIDSEDDVVTHRTNYPHASTMLFSSIDKYQSH